MPYKDLAKARECRRRWIARRRQDSAFSYAEQEAKRERRWRFHFWELAHMSESTKDLLAGLTHRTLMQITNPVFYFEIEGKVRKECLSEPLPKW